MKLHQVRCENIAISEMSSLMMNSKSVQLFIGPGIPKVRRIVQSVANKHPNYHIAHIARV